MQSNHADHRHRPGKGSYSGQAPLTLAFAPLAPLLRPLVRSLFTPQYIDPIVQATFQQDGQIREIVQCLSAKLRDPSQTVRGFYPSPAFCPQS